MKFLLRAWRLKALALLALLFSVSACSLPTFFASSTPQPATPASATSQPRPMPGILAAVEDTTARLEIFTWWLSGNDAAAFDALVVAMNQQYPSVLVVNATAANGGVAAAQPALQTRLQIGAPVDTWQVRAGAELREQYVRTGCVEAIDDLYEKNGWNTTLPQGLIELLQVDGKSYLAPVTVNRGNSLWYNKKLLTNNGIEIGDTLSVEQFLDAAETLKAAGIPALCMGDAVRLPAVQLFENTLLSVLGAERYKGLWDGGVAFDDAAVKQAITLYTQLLDYQNDDHATLSWDGAMKLLIEGKCAFHSTGDWAYAKFVAAGKKEGEDFGWVSYPGTDNAFMAIVEGFVLGKNAPDRASVQQWLSVVGDSTSQQSFNLLKGAICPRIDCDRKQFSAYHQSVMDSFAQATIVPSLAYGIAAPARFLNDFNKALEKFLSNQDIDLFSNALVEAANSAKFAQ